MVASKSRASATRPALRLTPQELAGRWPRSTCHPAPARARVTPAAPGRRGRGCQRRSPHGRGSPVRRRAALLPTSRAMAELSSSKDRAVSSSPRRQIGNAEGVDLCRCSRSPRSRQMARLRSRNRSAASHRTAPPGRRALPPRSVPPGARPFRHNRPRGGRLTRMQAHPDPDSDATGPVMAGKRALGRHAAADRVTSRLEHDEETVASVPISRPRQRRRRPQ